MSRLCPPTRAILPACCALLLAACVADTSTADLDPDELGGDDRGGAPAGVTPEALASGSLRVNDVYYVPKRDRRTDAPLFESATSLSVVRRVPQEAAVKIVIAEPSHERYRVDHAGTLGWMRDSDLTLRHRYDSSLSSTRISALARARTAMGISYWWSNARWPKTGPTTWPTNNVGECFGKCGGTPECTHAATGGGDQYGADCSGLVSTIWGYDDFDPDTNPKDNGFGTKAYSHDTAKWKTVPLADAQPGDAVVIHDEHRKHIVLLATKRNSDEVFQTYECAGCDQGCKTFRHKLNDASDWHAIRRTGW